MQKHAVSIEAVEPLELEIVIRAEKPLWATPLPIDYNLIKINRVGIEKNRTDNSPGLMIQLDITSDLRYDGNRSKKARFMSNDLRAIFVSDVHFPLHDPRMVELWLKVVKWWKPDSVDLLGDIDDADSTSRWANGAEQTVTVNDAGVDATKEFLKQINELVPNAEKHFHDGNHGYTRHELWLKKNAPQFLSVVTPESLYDYANYGFQWHRYDEPPVKRFSNLYAHHGESISKHAGESVRNDVLSWGVSLIRGHSHRQGVYHISYPLTHNVLSGYEIGHLCDPTKMDYDRSPNWQPGFAIAHIENGETAHVQLVEIHENIAYVDGKRFSC